MVTTASITKTVAAAFHAGVFPLASGKDCLVRIAHSYALQTRRRTLAMTLSRISGTADLDPTCMTLLSNLMIAKTPGVIPRF